MSTLTDASKKTWKIRGETACHQEIDTGSLQRIAAATELMAQGHARLVADRDMYERWYQQEQRDRRSAQRSNASLRGVVTKLKKRIAAMEAKP